MSGSVAVPVIDYRVHTACGRNFIWAATCAASLLNELSIKGYSVLMAMPNDEFEAGLDGYEQLELNSEHEGANSAA